ncbi:MAG: AgmX/PglI C-terminal domain-containing protein [Bdellovibrionota bacterium]
MDIERNKLTTLFEILPTGDANKSKGGVFPKGRLLLGRSESCDLMANHDSVSAIHAVLEIFEDKAVLYDMNSTNGTYINDDKIVVKELHVGDVFRLANVEYSFRKYVAATTSLPPVLDILEPSAGVASVRNLPPVPPMAPPESKSLPKNSPPVTEQMPSVVYPLAADPKAEFSEYIFEDKQQIYPIFRYETSRQAVEVIILFKDQIYSVDYLPEGKSTYYISGWWTSEQEVEFPYFGKAEKIPFVDVNGGTATVHTLPGFGVFFLSDRKKDTGHVGNSIELKGQDLVRFQKNDIQIFVRNVASPPKIAPAPILKRDPEFQKYLVLFMFFVVLISVGFNSVEVPEDEKKDELAPERLATILYKQPLYVNKNKSVAKTEDAPKVAQKAPVKVAVAKDAPKEKQPEVDKPDVVTTKDQTKKPDPGERNAKVKQVVKQGTERVTQPSNKIATNLAASKNNNNLNTKSAASAFSTANLQTRGPVEVYKSADFASSVNTMVAKGGTLSGIRTRGATGAGGGSDLVGAATGVSTGTGNIKTAEIATNQGSLVGAATGVLDSSKGSGGLSSKKAIYTAGIPSETVVLGSMDPDVIRRILLDHLPQFRYCYQKELEKTGADTSGTVKLDFTIAAAGNVSDAGIEGSSALPTDVKKCVVSVLRGIRFPEPMGGGKVGVKQPMNFYPKKL